MSSCHCKSEEEPYVEEKAPGQDGWMLKDRLREGPTKSIGDIRLLFENRMYRLINKGNDTPDSLTLINVLDELQEAREFIDFFDSSMQSNGCSIKGPLEDVYGRLGRPYASQCTIAKHIYEQFAGFAHEVRTCRDATGTLDKNK